MSRPDADVEEGHYRRSNEVGERRFDRGGREDAAEGEIREVIPEAAPPAREETGARGGVDAA